MGRGLIAAILLAALPVAPLGAAARDVFIVNGTGAPLRALVARPHDEKDDKTLVPGLSPGAKTNLSIDADSCAYDIRAVTPAGATLTWRGVNLCETRSVTLRRRDDGVLWVDYD